MLFGFVSFSGIFFSFLPFVLLGLSQSCGEKVAGIADYHSLDAMVPMLQQKPQQQEDLGVSTYLQTQLQASGCYLTVNQ